MTAHFQISKETGAKGSVSLPCVLASPFQGEPKGEGPVTSQVSQGCPASTKLLTL